MPIQHRNGILRDVGVSDNYMPEEFSSTNAYNIIPFPRLYVKLPARIVDEHSGNDGSAQFEIETNMFDEADVKASIDNFATEVTLSSGLVSFTGLTAGDYTLKVRGYRSPTSYAETVIPFKIYFIGDYQTKYTLTFQDNHDDETFTIRIKERGYTGSVIEYCAGADPAVIDWGFDSDSEIYGYNSLPSKCVLTMLVEEDGDYADLYDEPDPFKFKVEILRGEGVGATLFWQGWLSGNNYQVPLKDAPYQLNMVAYCGIGLLSSAFASYGSKYTGRIAWNHDKIPLTDLLWAIRRELRLSTTSSATPGPLGPNKILYFDFIRPAGHDTDYPAMFSETIDLRKLVEQDVQNQEPTSLIQLLTDILKPHFCKLIPYAGRWYIVPTTHYESSSFSGKLQSTRTTFTNASITSILPVVDGINADPAPDFSWRDNNQLITKTDIFGVVVVSHKNEYNGKIPIKPWFGERIGTLASTNTTVENNQAGWFYFFEDIADNPAPIRFNLQWARVKLDYAIGVNTQINTIPGYWAIEPVPFKRHSNSAIKSAFEIEFTSYNFDSGNTVQFRIQIFCAGYYLVIPTTDAEPTWEEMTVSTDDFDDYSQAIKLKDSNFEENSFDRRHKIQTPPVPDAILEQEHFCIRILTANNADYDTEQVVFIDNLSIVQQWVEEDDEGNFSILSNNVLEQVALEANTNSDNFIDLGLPIWNGPIIDGCTTTYGNPVSMPSDAPIQSITNGTWTMNKAEFWANQLKVAYTNKRQIITGSINKHIELWKHPVYRDVQHIVVQQSHDLKANKSSIVMIELPENYSPADLIFTIDTALPGHPSFIGATGREVAFIVTCGALGGQVNWGDGTVDNITAGETTARSHQYETTGTFQITISSAQTFAFQAQEGGGASGKISSIQLIGSNVEYIDVTGPGNVITEISTLIQPSASTNANTIGYARYIFSYNALDTLDVNDILSQMVEWTVTGTLNLANQSVSAPPSGQGVTDKASMQADGWTVTTD